MTLPTIYTDKTRKNYRTVNDVQIGPDRIAYIVVKAAGRSYEVNVWSQGMCLDGFYCLSANEKVIAEHLAKRGWDLVQVDVDGAVQPLWRQQGACMVALAVLTRP